MLVVPSDIADGFALDWLAPSQVNSGPDLSLHGQRLRWILDALLTDVLSLLSQYLYRVGDTGELCNAFGARACGVHSRVGERHGRFKCVVSHVCADPSEELQRFHRCMRIAGRFAHALHDRIGVPVRGVHAQMLESKP